MCLIGGLVVFGCLVSWFSLVRFVIWVVMGLRLCFVINMVRGVLLIGWVVLVLVCSMLDGGWSCMLLLVVWWVFWFMFWLMIIYYMSSIRIRLCYICGFGSWWLDISGLVCMLILKLLIGLLMMVWVCIFGSIIGVCLRDIFIWLCICIRWRLISVRLVGLGWMLIKFWSFNLGSGFSLLFWVWFLLYYSKYLFVCCMVLLILG